MCVCTLCPYNISLLSNLALIYVSNLGIVCIYIIYIDRYKRGVRSTFEVENFDIRFVGFCAFSRNSRFSWFYLISNEFDERDENMSQDYRCLQAKIQREPHNIQHLLGYSGEKLRSGNLFYFFQFFLFFGRRRRHFSWRSFQRTKVWLMFICDCTNKSLEMMRIN